MKAGLTEKELTEAAIKLAKAIQEMTPAIADATKNMDRFNEVAYKIKQAQK